MIVVAATDQHLDTFVAQLAAEPKGRRARARARGDRVKDITGDHHDLGTVLLQESFEYGIEGSVDIGLAQVHSTRGLSREPATPQMEVAEMSDQDAVSVVFHR